MPNKFDEMRSAIAEASETFSAADHVANQMADMLRGRLRKVRWVSTLRALKRELSDFNAHTGTWRE